MKKRTGERSEIRRLMLRKELIRHLDVKDLTRIVGGCDPQCLATKGTTSD
jgi:hypothetical protein